MMLERQVEDLESFNNELIEKQNQLTAEKYVTFDSLKWLVQVYIRIVLKQRLASF